MKSSVVYFIVIVIFYVLVDINNIWDVRKLTFVITGIEWLEAKKILVESHVKQFFLHQ